MKEMHGLMADNVGTADTWGGGNIVGCQCVIIWCYL